MRFFGIVTLTIALLQREGRITYWALKRGFELDDASLEDLRRERIFRCLARDEAGEGLARIGEVPAPVAAPAGTSSCARRQGTGQGSPWGIGSDHSPHDTHPVAGHILDTPLPFLLQQGVLYRR